MAKSISRGRPLKKKSKFHIDPNLKTSFEVQIGIFLALLQVDDILNESIKGEIDEVIGKLRLTVLLACKEIDPEAQILAKKLREYLISVQKLEEI